MSATTSLYMRLKSFADGAIDLLSALFLPIIAEALFSSPEAYKAHLNGQYIDWADELLQTGVTQNYSLSVSGGTEKTKAYFSLKLLR